MGLMSLKVALMKDAKPIDGVMAKRFCYFTDVIEDNLGILVLVVIVMLLSSDIGRGATFDLGHFSQRLRA